MKVLHGLRTKLNTRTRRQDKIGDHTCQPPPAFHPSLVTARSWELNPVVSVAFALRREFPWRRVPLYVVAQLVGASLACLLLWAMFGKVG
ncbi:MAG: hypothetical protein B7X07_07175, partial [Actinobacteria bacterium 21-64-8]